MTTKTYSFSSVSCYQNNNGKESFYNAKRENDNGRIKFEETKSKNGITTTRYYDNKLKIDGKAEKLLRK